MTGTSKDNGRTISVRMEADYARTVFEDKYRLEGGEALIFAAVQNYVLDTDRIRSLEGQVDELKAEKEKQEGRKAAIRDEWKRAATKIQELEEQITAKDAEIAENKTVLNARAARIRQLEEELSNRRAKLEGMAVADNAEAEKWRAKWEEATAEIERQDKELEYLKGRVSDLVRGAEAERQHGRDEAWAEALEVVVRTLGGER